MDKIITKNNKGVSLVELIVVISILSIIGSGVFIGLSMISGKPAMSLCNKVESCLERNRTVSMGKANSQLTISYEADGYYSEEVLDGITTKTKIGDTKVAVSVSNGTTTYTMGLNDKIIINFDRSDGSLDKVVYNDNSNVLFDTAHPCNSVTFTFSKANTTKSVAVTPATGRVSK